MLPYIIIGKGSHSVVVAEIATVGYHRPNYLVDFDDPLDWGPFEFTVAVGNNEKRREIFLRATRGFPRTVKHPFSCVSNSAKIGHGTVIAPGVVVNPEAEIGVNCILNTSCSVDHHCRIGDHCHIGPHACLAGRVTVGVGVLVGAGAVILPGVNLGDGASVGAGAVVVRDVDKGATVVGNPANKLWTPSAA